jgi:electron transport complex protein RnfE
MSNPTLSDIAANGLWKNNGALVQVLGLCPLLAMSSSAVNALGMGIATIFVLTVSNMVVSAIRNVVSNAIRLPVFVMIIAAAVTFIQLLMQAYTFELYQILGVFLPLITTNCIILGRAESFACKNGIFASAFDGFMMGLGYAMVLFTLGFLRELFGTGHVFADMHLLLGPVANNWMLTPFPNYPQFLYIVLPPGAFIFMGCLMACKKWLDAGINARHSTPIAKTDTTARRVRLTGKTAQDHE